MMTIRKICNICKIALLFSSFAKKKRKHGKKDTLSYACRECLNNRAKENNFNNPSVRAKYRSNPNYKRVRKDRELRLAYGLSLDDYQTLLLKQLGCCAICLMPDSSNRHLAVDHDHATGGVRGLLCSRCNRALGAFKDDPDVLKRAILYLAQHRGGMEPYKDFNFYPPVIDKPCETNLPDPAFKPMCK